MQRVRLPQIALVQCGKRKVQRPCCAEDMYVGSLFSLTRAYVKGHFATWYILSAKYGVMHPKQWIEPYDTKAERGNVEWARQCVATLLASHRVACATLFAGDLYTEHLAPMLQSSGWLVTNFFAGLPDARIGYRLQHLNKASGFFS